MEIQISSKRNKFVIKNIQIILSSSLKLLTYNNPLSFAKNQKNNSKAKNASIMEYKLATGLEAVFGYLYLEKNFERLEEMFNYIIKLYEEKQ